MSIRRINYKIILFSSLLALFIHTSFLSLCQIESTSMLPTLAPHRIVFVAPSSYSFRVPFTRLELFHIRDPQRMEIVLFSMPKNPHLLLIKRVIGVGGDRVEIKNGKILLNQQPFTYQESQKEFQKELDDAPSHFIETFFDANPHPVIIENIYEDYGPIQVPKQYVFLLGDNRSQSLDSRDLGPVHLSFLKGKLLGAW